MTPFTAWAPGRVNLIGEHTDYAGGLVLPAAIQLGVSVHVHELAEDVHVDAGEPYARAVEHELAELGRPAVGLRATVTSDLPAGAGLSSSAALEVAFALALCAVADFELAPLALAEACRRAELRATGVPCGILDQAACVLGEAGAAVFLDCGTLEHRTVPLPREAALLVADSGVRRSLADSAYAQRRSELEAGVPARVRHVESENARVRAFVEALWANDLVTAGALLSASHRSLRDDYEVSTPELDELAARCEAAGAYGARLHGGGFGGSVLALVRADAAAEIAAAAGSAFVAQPSAGAGLR